MLLFTKVLCLTVLTSSIYLPVIINARLWESPEQEAWGAVVGENFDEKLSEIGQLILDELDYDMFTDMELSATATDIENYAECWQCRLVVGTLIEAIRDRQLPWELCRNVSIGICNIILTNATDWNQDVVCPGVIDAYGPHVYYIISVTNDTTEEICQLFNMCPYDSSVRDAITRQLHQVQGRPWQESRPQPSPSRSTPAERRANAIKIVHLADIHVDPEYLEGSNPYCDLPLCCRDGEGQAGPWGNFVCNLPEKTVELFMKFVSNLSADIVVYAGDSPASAVWEETQEGQLNISRYIAESIARYMPDTPAYSTIGNHETYPTNLYYVGRPEIQEFNREYARYWQQLSRLTDEQMATLAYAGYFEIQTRPGLRVLSYNSNYGYTDNFYNLLNDDAPDFLDMQQFMEDTFNKARQNGEKILLIGHHVNGGSGSHLFYTDFLQDILKRNGDLIVLYMLGHTHVDEYKMLTDLQTGDVYAVQVAAPCVNSSPYRNPSARLYFIDPVTFDVIDYEQYSMDLEAALKNKAEPTIDLIYRFTEEYGMPDATPISFKQLTDRFETEPDLFYTYRYHRVTRTSEPEPCFGPCLNQELCKMRTIAYDTYQNCTSRTSL